MKELLNLGGFLVNPRYIVCVNPTFDKDGQVIEVIVELAWRDEARMFEGENARKVYDYLRQGVAAFEEPAA